MSDYAALEALGRADALAGKPKDPARIAYTVPYCDRACYMLGYDSVAKEAKERAEIEAIKASNAALLASDRVVSRTLKFK